jgi:hypothetical protein
MSKATNHLKLFNGNELKLTPGKHGKLLLAVLTKFVPHFVPEATLLYIGDITNKLMVSKQEQLEKLNVPIIAHDQLPDIILYQEARNWLYLIEIVTSESQGPVSHERRQELERILANCTAERLYLSVFQKLADFARYASDVAYESHIWIAERPEHMIHYN